MPASKEVKRVCREDWNEVITTFAQDKIAIELSVEIEPKKATVRTTREERIISGFKEIQRFVDTFRHAPRHGERHDVFEQLHAVRLDRIREQEECRALLALLDHQGLLAEKPEGKSSVPDNMDDDALLAELPLRPPLRYTISHWMASPVTTPCCVSDSESGVNKMP